MNEQQIRAIIQDEMNQQRYRAGKPTILVHNHDGVNSPKIHGVNVIANDSYVYELLASAGTAQLTLNSIANPVAISFYGIARNPPTGTATYKAAMSGSAQFGNVETNKLGPPTIANIAQANSSVFFDGSTSLVDKNSTHFTNWIPEVHVDNAYLVNVVDVSGNSVVLIQIIGFTNTSVTLQSSVANDWFLEGTVIIS